MCDKCKWADYENKCEDMLNDSDYEFALDTIEGIYNWIQSNSHVTEKQKESIDNIYESVNEKENDYND